MDCIIRVNYITADLPIYEITSQDRLRKFHCKEINDIVRKIGRIRLNALELTHLKLKHSELNYSP